MLAAAGGRTDIVALLVEVGADVNQINPVSHLVHFLMMELCNLCLANVAFYSFLVAIHRRTATPRCIMPRSLGRRKQ